MNENIIKFPQHSNLPPLGPTMPPIQIGESKESAQDDFAYDICHKLCEELFDDFAWGNKSDFDFDELVEFAKTLLLKTALWNISMERVEYLELLRKFKK